MTDDLTRLRRLAGMLVESATPEPTIETDEDTVEESDETDGDDTENLAESYARFMEAGRYSKDFTDGVPPEDREDCEDCGGSGEIGIPTSGGDVSYRTCSNCDGLGWFEKHHEEELDEDSLPTSGAPENALFETQIAGLKIALYQWEDRSFSVQCGMQENAKLNYDKATVTLGKAIMFALGQEGTISK
jgi:hypothetical protein